MPIYEYHCSACQQDCEILQKISDTAAPKCPHCGKAKLIKQISTTSFQLKGEGWYVTDFRDKNKPKASTEEKATTENSTKLETAENPKTTTEEKSNKKEKKAKKQETN